MTAGPFTECLLCAKHYSSIHAAPKINKQGAKHWEYKCTRWGAYSFSGACRLEGETDKQNGHARVIGSMLPACQAQSRAGVQKSTDVDGREKAS